MVFLIHLIRDGSKKRLAFLKPFSVMIADDIRKLCVRDLAGHMHQREKALASFGVFGCFCFRQKTLDLASNSGCVYHDVLCGTRMDIYALDLKRSSGGVKVFIGDLAFVIAVNRVSIICLEIIKIKKIRSASDFFVRGETDPDVAVWNVLTDDLFHCG